MYRDSVTLVLLAVGVGSAAETVVVGFVAWMLATAFASGRAGARHIAPGMLALADVGARRCHCCITSLCDDP